MTTFATTRATPVSWGVALAPNCKDLPNDGEDHADRQKLIKVGAKVVSHGQYMTFQIAQVAVPRQMFQEILSLIARLRAPPALE